MLQECCTVLDVPEPELYVGTGNVNAFTAGHNNPYIVLWTELLDVMNDDEIMAVIAHEVGHIKCNHVLYKAMARVIAPLLEVSSEFIPVVGELIGTALQATFESTLLVWDRRSELSADRASLLVMQDARPCISMLMKLAGGSSRFGADLNPEEFLHQAQAYGEDLDSSTSGKLYRFLANMAKGSHPFAIERAKILNDWVDSDEFGRILAGDYVRTVPAVKNGLCPHCNAPVSLGDLFCMRCGQRIGVA
jgi:Zn-dependent protease with chaperone function